MQAKRLGGLARPFVPVPVPGDVALVEVSVAVVDILSDCHQFITDLLAGKMKKTSKKLYERRPLRNKSAHEPFEAKVEKIGCNNEG